jgi:hypothetical protein
VLSARLNLFSKIRFLQRLSEIKVVPLARRDAI